MGTKQVDASVEFCDPSLQFVNVFQRHEVRQMSTQFFQTNCQRPNFAGIPVALRLQGSKALLEFTQLHAERLENLAIGATREADGTMPC